jgi:undecaprenyl-phosphate alpha-N-acetylglucosaminyl 1-phosphatetransferase
MLAGAALDFLMILLSALTGLAVARKTAPVIGLLDKPDARKVHDGHIPLVGGISVWIALCAVQMLNPGLIEAQPVFWFCLSLLLVVGVIDDRFNLPVLPRVIVQALTAVLMMKSGYLLSTLGELVPGYVVVLGGFGYLFTLVAIWASINAFNMIDGIDGLLGAVSCVTFTALAWLFYQHGHYGAGQWSLALVLALLPYLAANLGLFGGNKRKVFMGDAGSTVVGFAAIWLLVIATQSEEKAIAPVNALWLIAVPLADMSAVCLRRLRSRVSPFRPDRGHIHHIVMKCGFSPRKALVILFLAAVVCAVVGMVFDHIEMPEWISLMLFLAAFAGWYRFSSRVFHRSV